MILIENIVYQNKYIVMNEKMNVYINPLTDFGFKRIFGQEKNKELLIDFLNEIIGEEQRIADIDYQPTFQIGGAEDERKAVFDICCKNEKDENFIVEMQKAKQAYFVDRSLFYATFPIQNQAPQGSWNFELKAVYTVAILDFILFDDTANCIEKIYLTRENTKTKYSDKLNFVFVELPKFKKPLEELVTNFDNWLFCLKNLSSLNARPMEVQGRIFEILFRTAEIKKLTKTEMETYSKSVLEYDDIRDAMNHASETAYEKGIEQGILKVARKLLELKLPVLDIAKATGLTPEQILEL